MKRLYVGNIPYKFDDEQLGSLFAQYGAVESCNIVMDRESGRSKGFGFVTFTNDDEASAAIAALDGSEIEGRALRVSEAREREQRNDRPPRSGGGGGGGGGGGYRGGGGGGGGGGNRRRNFN